jgi:hypothetical protein
LSDLTVVRKALGDKLGSLDVNVHDSWGGTIVVPAAIVVPASGTYIQYGVTTDGMNDALFSIQLLVSRANDWISQERLDAFMSPTGAQSVVQAVSGAVGDAHWAVVKEARNYGTRTVQNPSGGSESYLGVEFLVSVGLY